jgi:Zn-dependent membrane protease YugP
MLIFIAIFLVSMIIQNRLKSKFEYYSKMSLSNGMSGKEIAEKMLHDNGIYDVQVISVEGQLTDHYNPANKTVNLSEAVYLQRNAAAAAVAAHECGHAVQHAVGYNMLKMRSAMVPVVNFSSRILQFIFLAGFAFMFLAKSPFMLYIAVILFGITTLFSFVTLPVEYDASNRALAWLEKSGTLGREEHNAAKDSLKWAARTYVVAALGSLAQLLYYLNMLNRR